MAHWRRHEPTIGDGTVFWLAIGLAVVMAFVGWVTA